LFFRQHGTFAAFPRGDATDGRDAEESAGVAEPDRLPHPPRDPADANRSRRIPGVPRVRGRARPGVEQVERLGGGASGDETPPNDPVTTRTRSPASPRYSGIRSGLSQGIRGAANWSLELRSTSIWARATRVRPPPGSPGGAPALRLRPDDPARADREVIAERVSAPEGCRRPWCRPTPLVLDGGVRVPWPMVTAVQ
jgi:hypothetical protein